jgi:catechol 2,3-dioxygenase-like lactoylglutathione lyase family enzyme
VSVSVPVPSWVSEPVPEITPDMALSSGMHHITAIGADIQRTHAFYGDLLAKVQQLDPHAMHVVLGTREQVSFTCSEYSRYFRGLLQRFRIAIGAPPTETYLTPCAKCSTCARAGHCNQQRSSGGAPQSGLRRDSPMTAIEYGSSPDRSEVSRIVMAHATLAGY